MADVQRVNGISEVRERTARHGGPPSRRIQWLWRKWRVAVDFANLTPWGMRGPRGERVGASVRGSFVPSREWNRFSSIRRSGRVRPFPKATYPLSLAPSTGNGFPPGERLFFADSLDEKAAPIACRGILPAGRVVTSGIVASDESLTRTTYSPVPSQSLTNFAGA